MARTPLTKEDMLVLFVHFHSPNWCRRTIRNGSGGLKLHEIRVSRKFILHFNLFVELVLEQGIIRAHKNVEKLSANIGNSIKNTMHLILNAGVGVDWTYVASTENYILGGNQDTSEKLVDSYIKGLVTKGRLTILAATQSKVRTTVVHNATIHLLCLGTYVVIYLRAVTMTYNQKTWQMRMYWQKRLNVLIVKIRGQRLNKMKRRSMMLTAQTID